MLRKTEAEKNSFNPLVKIYLTAKVIPNITLPSPHSLCTLDQSIQSFSDGVQEKLESRLNNVTKSTTSLRQKS